jgi:hypothetical protein
MTRWKRRLLTALGVGGTGSLTNCILQAPGTIEATPGAWSKIKNVVTSVRWYVEPMITGTTISGTAAVLGFGAAALILGQSYLVRWFPRIAGWLPKMDATPPPPPVSAAPTLAGAELDHDLQEAIDRISRLELEIIPAALSRSASSGSDGDISRIEKLLQSEAEKLSGAIASLGVDLRKEIEAVSARTDWLIEIANRARQRKVLEEISSLMKEAEENLKSTQANLAKLDSHSEFEAAQGKISLAAARLSRLFNISDLEARMSDKIQEVNDEVRRKQIAEHNALRNRLQRQYNLLDGEINRYCSYLDSKDYETFEWLSSWQIQKYSRRS